MPSFFRPPYGLGKIAHLAGFPCVFLLPWHIGRELIHSGSPMKYAAFAALTFIAALSPKAFAEKVRAQGIEVEAKEISYYVDSNIVHHFRLVQPTKFSFIRGNTFLAHDEVYLNTDSSISTIVSYEPQELSWELPQGRVLKIDCGQKKNMWGDLVPRVVNFYPNGEYKSGCSAKDVVSFPETNGKEVAVFGDIDLLQNGGLAYASRVSTGDLSVNGQEVGLLPGSELAFHPSGAPYFFTLIHGQSFRVKQAQFGEVLFTQNAGLQVSTSLFENGAVERGIIGQELSFPELDLKIPAGSGVAFDQKGGELAISLALFSQPMRLQAGSYSFLIKKAGFNPEMGHMEVTSDEAFTFTNPDSGTQMDVPPGSLILLSETREILAIQTPLTQPKFERKQLSL
jgi:hypothetical protein